MPSSSRIFHLNRQLCRPQLSRASIRINDEARRKFASRRTDAPDPWPPPRVDLPPCPNTTAPFLSSAFASSRRNEYAKALWQLYGASPKPQRDPIRDHSDPIRRLR